MLQQNSLCSTVRSSHFMEWLHASFRLPTKYQCSCQTSKNTAKMRRKRCFHTCHSHHGSLHICLDLPVPLRSIDQNVRCSFSRRHLGGFTDYSFLQAEAPLWSQDEQLHGVAFFIPSSASKTCPSWVCTYMSGGCKTLFMRLQPCTDGDCTTWQHTPRGRQPCQGRLAND